MFDMSLVAQIQAAYTPPAPPKPKKCGKTPGRLHRDMILAFLPKTNGVSRREIQEKFGISKTCACHNLQELRRDGLAKQSGKTGGIIQWVKV